MRCRLRRQNPFQRDSVPCASMAAVSPPDRISCNNTFNALTGNGIDVNSYGAANRIKSAGLWLEIKNKLEVSRVLECFWPGLLVAILTWSDRVNLVIITALYHPRPQKI